MRAIGALIVIALAVVLGPKARADTYCPTVSSQVQILNANITGSPQPIALASYDLNTKGLMVQFAGPGNKATYFVGVPSQLIVGRTNVPWSTISSYPQAYTQEQSPCPLLSSAGTPLLSTGNAITTVTPFVLPPCPLVSDGTQLSVAQVYYAPYSIYQAVYDAKTQFLTIQFVSGISVIFVGVPKSVATSAIQWNNLYQYMEALMVEQSACPYLSGGAVYSGFIFGTSAFGVGSF